MTSDSPLDGTVVVDATSSVSGQYAGKLLAAHGANVVLIEPPAGTATRRMEPLHGAESLLFVHLNQGKRSVVADTTTHAGAALLQGLCSRADVVLHDQGFAPTEDPAGHQITCAFGDFPADGPYANWQGTEMIHQALSGLMFMTGEPTKPPLYGLGHRAYYACGVTGYVSVLAALFERAASGLGQQCTATVFESAAAMAQNIVTQYSYSQSYSTRAKYPGFQATLQCADGWVVLFALRHWPVVCAAFHADDLAGIERFRAAPDRLHNWHEVTALLQERSIGLPARQVVAEAQAGKVSVEVVETVPSLLTSEQWTARGMTRHIASGNRREFALGPVFRIDGAPYRTEIVSPRLGEHTTELTEMAEAVGT